MATSQTPEVVGATEGDAELLDQLDKSYPEAWIAKNEGDTIVGAFISLETGQTSFGPAPVAVLGTAEGERSVFLFYESLKTGFRRAQPELGEKVAIRYLGEKPAKNPTPGRSATFHDFAVAVDRPKGKAVDWSAALPVDVAPTGDEPEPGDVPL